MCSKSRQSFMANGFLLKIQTFSCSHFKVSIHPLFMHYICTFVENYLLKLLTRVCKLMFTALKSNQKEHCLQMSTCACLRIRTHFSTEQRGFWLATLAVGGMGGRRMWRCWANTHAHSRSPPCWCYCDGCRCCWTPPGRWRRVRGR